MQRFTRILLLVALLAAASETGALSLRSHRPDVELASRGPVSNKVTFDYSGAELMAPHDVELVRRLGRWTYNDTGKQLLMAVIAQNGAIASAACGVGGPVTCAIGVLYASFSFFFAAFLFSERDGAVGHPNTYFVLPPTPEKTLVERLTTELEPGTWHYVGYVHHNGLNHSVEYFNGGRWHTLRARNVPFWNADIDVSARDNTINDGGFVGDYNWDNNNKAPYDSFHSSTDSTHYFANNAGGWMVNSQKAIAACADFSDSQGTLDHGIFSMGWNNQPFEWQDGQMDAEYEICLGETKD